MVLAHKSTLPCIYITLYITLYQFWEYKCCYIEH